MNADELIAGATKVRPILERNADRADRDRRLPDETVNAMHEVGVFRILTPRRFGGCEADLGTLVEVVGQMSQGCCSAGWLTLLMPSCTWLAALYPEQAQEEVFASGPDVRTAGVLAPTGTARPQAGGMVVTGRWSYMSGILHAQWALVGVQLPHIGPQAFGLALIPMHEMRVEDTWYMAGMRGTGSNTAVADDVFLPAHRIFPFSEAIHTDRYPTPHTGALYRYPLAPALATMLMMVYPGMAQAALDYVRDHATARGIGYSSYSKQSTSVAFQLHVAEAATKIDTAWLYTRRAPQRLTQAAEADHPLTPIDRAWFRRDLGHVAALCRDAVNTLVQAYGAGAFSESCPLQRIWRDCNVASTHAVANPLINQETFGRALLGEPPITPLL